MRLLITGASGQLGGYLLRELRGTDHDIVAWSGSREGEVFGVPLRRVNVSDPDRVLAAFEDARPDVVIHAGAVTSVTGCYRDPVAACRTNITATAQLCELCNRFGARMVFTSTDLVFDGARGHYREADSAAPLSIYGQTKLDAEAAVMAYLRGAVARLSLLYGPSTVSRPSFFDDQVTALRQRRPITLFSDEWRTPLDFQTAARALLALAESEFAGLLHLGGPQRMNRAEMGHRLAVFLGADPAAIIAANRADVPSPEPRPRDASLDSTRWRALFPGIDWPAYADALRQMFAF
jgi:dTDP-4-dehydrorhamnose reductase